MWGGPGYGKSQLAVRYAETHRDKYNPIIWIDASNPTTAAKIFAYAFQQLELEFPSSYLDEIRKEISWNPRRNSTLKDDWYVSLVLDWLKNRDELDCEWLVIIDNANDQWWIRDILPRGPRGAVILTSRDMLIGEYAEHHIEVNRLSRAEGLETLLNGIMQPRESSASNLTDAMGAKRLEQLAIPIMETLGYSALLLNLANHYIMLHPLVKEKISLYLDYHDKMSLSLLDKP